MAKYKYREGSYGYEEPIGFESIRSMIDDEISDNKKTDAKQSEDIENEGEERKSADEQIDQRLSELEEQAGSSSELKENFDEFTGSTYPADKEVLEAKDSELETAIAEKANSADVEELQNAVETLNGEGEGSIKKIAEDAAVAEVAKVVAEAPEDLDTLKEVADYIASDKTKAAEIETKLSDHDSAIEALGAKDEELQSSISEKANASDLEDEVARAKEAEQALEEKVDSKADNDALDAEIARAMTKEGELQAAIAEKASNDDLRDEKERAVAAEEALSEALGTKADASTVTDELTALKTKDEELMAKDSLQDEEIAKKVEWTESTPGRNHIVLKNHDSVLGTATDGTTYNLAMVSKWDVADFGSAQLHANLNSKDGVVTINDDKAVATKDEVEAVETKVDAIDLTPYAKSEEVNAELANKANASDLSALNATVEELSSKVEEKALQSDLEAEVARAEAKEAELVEKDAELETAINDEAVRATAAESELQGKITAEQARAEAKEAELEAAIPTAAAQAVAQVVADAPEDLDTLKEVADYIAADKTKAAEVETKLAALEAKDAAQDTVINGKVDRNMNGANGKALIFNESDGGGAKFEHNDGTWSFAGVNDGGENGIAGQVYAVKKNAEGKMEGTRIDVTKGAMYYTVGAASAAERMTEANEIAVKGDIDAAVNAIEIPSIEGLAKSADVTSEIASAVAPLAVKDDVDAALETKADADKVYTQDEVNNMLAEKQAEIDTMAADFKKLKEIVGDLGGAVEYSVPADGKLTDMLKKSGVIKLTEDVESNTYAGGITSKNITTLNLNGKTITTTANTTTNPSIMVRGKQQFTIQGGGTLNANGHIAIEANGEDAVITLGGTAFGKPTYVTNREGELIYCYLGTINITNGVFRNDNENKAFLLNCYDANYQNGTAKIVVTGGKFYDFDPANNASEGEGTSYVPDGYVSVASTETIDGVEHTVYTVKKA